jgi:hypothetical protein
MTSHPEVRCRPPETGLLSQRRSARTAVVYRARTAPQTSAEAWSVTSSGECMRMHVRHVSDGGPGRRSMYFATVVRETVMPSFASPPCIRRAPQRTCSRLICRISARVSAAMAGRPGRFRSHGRLRSCHNPCRRQRRPVAVCVISRASGHRDHNVESMIQKHRSTGETRGRVTERAKTARWCRSAMVSRESCQCSHSVAVI